jgi:ferredoxin-fold anticodon binding domain-containing protein
MIKQKVKSPKLSSEELTQIAQSCVKKALINHDISQEIRSNLVLGKGFEGDWRIFDLYIPGERSEDAQMICTAKVNIYTGEASVNVFLEKSQENLAKT